MYGSPVPGYAAPAATIGPAGRVAVVLLGVVAEQRDALGPAAGPAAVIDPAATAVGLP